MLFDTFFSLDKTVGAKIIKDCNYPHEALPKIKEFIYYIGNLLPSDRYKNISDGVWVANNATVAENVRIFGPCIIDEGAEIRHCAFIRGSVIIGKGAVVGNSTELKNVILFDKVQVPHYNYVGDSILGYKAHFGAGAITSNVKNDKSNVKISYGEQFVDSNMKKLGAIIGDNVEIGCGSVLNPGTVIGKNTNIYPLSSIRGYIKENSIYKNSNDIVYKEAR